MSLTPHSSRPKKIWLLESKQATAPIQHARAFVLKDEFPRLEIICDRRLPDSAANHLLMVRIAEHLEDGPTYGASSWQTTDSDAPYLYEVHLAADPGA